MARLGLGGGIALHCGACLCMREKKHIDVVAGACFASQSMHAHFALLCHVSLVAIPLMHNLEQIQHMRCLQVDLTTLTNVGPSRQSAHSKMQSCTTARAELCCLCNAVHILMHLMCVDVHAVCFVCVESSCFV